MSIETYNEISTVFRFVGLVGADVDVPANPLAAEACGDRDDCPTGLTIDPTGARIAWLQPQNGDGELSAELIVQGVNDTEPSSTVTIEATMLAEGLQTWTVELSGGLAVVNRADSARAAGDGLTPAPALLVDLESGEVTELPETGHATLTRPAT